MEETARAGMKLTGGVSAAPGLTENAGAPFFTFDVTCRDEFGNVMWEETVHNTVMVTGKNDLLNQYFKGSAYTAAWYAGLVGSGTIANTDTSASHPGWAEVTAYTQSPRPTIAFGTTSAGSNTASAVTFTMNGAYTVAGMFIINNSTIGGSTGVLYSAGDFATARSGGSGDTLNITPTVTIS